MMVEPLLNVLISLLFFTILITAVARLANIKDAEKQKALKGMYNALYPLLIQISLILNANFYSQGLAYEREQMIRHLLKF